MLLSFPDEFGENKKCVKCTVMKFKENAIYNVNFHKNISYPRMVSSKTIKRNEFLKHINRWYNIFIIPHQNHTRVWSFSCAMLVFYRKWILLINRNQLYYIRFFISTLFCQLISLLLHNYNPLKVKTLYHFEFQDLKIYLKTFLRRNQLNFLWIFYLLYLP